MKKDILQFMMEEEKQSCEHDGGGGEAAANLEKPSASNPDVDNDCDMFGDLENVDEFPIETTTKLIY